MIISHQHQYLKKEHLHRWIGYGLRQHINISGVFLKDLAKGGCYPLASFIGGFGPRTGRLFDSVVKKYSELPNQQQSLSAMKNYMSESMWENIAGPLRLYEGRGDEKLPQVFDRTIIHPNWHEDTTILSTFLEKNNLTKRTEITGLSKIIREALSRRGNEEHHITEHSFILKEILEKVFSKGEFRGNLLKLEFILEKLFDHIYEEAKNFISHIKSDEILERRFYDVFPKTKGMRLEERIVKGRIVQISDRSMRFVVYDEIPGLMMLNDLRNSEDEIKECELNKFYMVGQEIYVKVMKVQYDLLR